MGRILKECLSHERRPRQTLLFLSLGNVSLRGQRKWPTESMFVLSNYLQEFLVLEVLESVTLSTWTVHGLHWAWGGSREVLRGC